MTDTIAVTGAAGGVGSWTVERLRERWQVLAMDQERPPGSAENVDFQVIDLREHGQVWELFDEAAPSTVVHFGNIPSALHHPDGAVYENNTLANYAVLDAAGRVGADVIWASSETVYGTHYAEPEIPSYLPIDEGHPIRLWTGYETSKYAGEAVADRINTIWDVNVLSLRPSWVQYPGEYEAKRPDTVDVETLEPEGNYWSYIDVRDIVDLVEAAIAEPPDGHECVNVHAPDNYLGVETAAAIDASYGHLPDRVDITGTESAFSTAKAERLFDWEPTHLLERAATESVQRPALLGPD